MGLLKKERIVMSIRLGGNVENCIREAIRVAAKHECDVEFSHNDRKILIPYAEYFSRAYREWDSPENGQ